ncbi:MAG: DUF1501 domain-containing protein [Pirellulaceae bacterium]|nr:DUF1501 domain-containing protein [Pirellulaceae bacterium]
MTIVISDRKYCDGMIRRDALRVGAASLFGTSFSLPQLLAGQAKSPAMTRYASAQSLIIVFLEGGLSTIDTWDMKPQAPSEYRGEFQPISTSVPGVQICEHLPQLSTQMDKFALVRSFGHSDSGHVSADHFMLTGYRTEGGFNGNNRPNNQKPSYGASLSRSLGPAGSVPPYVCLPKMHRSSGASHLGTSYAPFVIAADPNAPDFEVPDLMPPLEVASSRLGRRKQVLEAVNRYSRRVESMANRNAHAFDLYQHNAFSLMTSQATKEAFDINCEADEMRDAYGRNSLGQSCLMARRLVEAGVRCVMIDHSNWDTHFNNFEVLKTDLLPKLDAAMSTLFRDLHYRGMLESTLVLVTGEFGRTPKVNKNAGRDHWGPSTTIAIGGGGVQGGRLWEPPTNTLRDQPPALMDPPIWQLQSFTALALISKQSFTRLRDVRLHWCQTKDE